MIHEFGKIEIAAADDMNVPVDIWLLQMDPKFPDAFPWTVRGESAAGMQWCLRANNYMPRKGCLSGEGSYMVFSDSREELAALVREHVLPLYRAALDVVTCIADGSQDCLYYWEKSTV
jgi:hypothetical protein